jgi:hypothetical protein
MNFMESIAPVATILSGITAGVIIVSEDHRIRLGMLALQYICVTSLVGLNLPVNIAIIKLISGWLACILLGITITQMGQNKKNMRTGVLQKGWIFKMIAVLLVSTSAIGIGTFHFFDILGIQRVSIASTVLLVGLGILQLGLTEQPIGVGMGLLTIMSGFEILYSSLEPSLVIMALLASIHIGISMAVTIISIDVTEREESRISK